MSSNIVPLDANEHSSLKIKSDKTYSHASKQYMVTLVAAEFLSSSTNFPIFFVKQQETGKFKSVALMGFEEGENVVFSNNKVNSTYVPVHFRRQPFAVGGSHEDSDNMILCVDTNSPLVSAKEGVALFDEQKNPSEMTTNVSDMLVDLIAKEKATDLFIETLLEYDLLEIADLKINLGDAGERKINGLYKISEEVLNKLPDDQVLSLYNSKYFASIYCHLASLSQIKRLLDIKSVLDKKQ
jgi:hypothetical protein